MDRNMRLSHPITLFTLALSVASLGACEQGPPWPRVGAATMPKPCDNLQPGPAPQPEPGQPEAPEPEAPGTTTGPLEPSSTQQATEAITSDTSATPSEASSDAEPASSVGLQLWELLYDPERSDGLAKSPEVVDLLVTGAPQDRGTLRFELSGQGWSRMSEESFGPELAEPVTVGTIIRIERYKNKTELETANLLFPERKVVDPSSGRVAVRILRHTGAGLRNKGGWVALRSGPELSLRGIIYGDIDPEKVDPELQAQWKGPRVPPAPAGQALCQIPEQGGKKKSDAAWWTACQASSWGREPEDTKR